MKLSAAEKAALMRVRHAWDEVRAEADAMHSALVPQLRELESPDVWLSNEARRVVGQLQTAQIGVRNRRDDAQEILDHIDVALRTP